MRLLCAPAWRRLAILSAVGALVVVAAASLVAAREHGSGFPDGWDRQYGVTGRLQLLRWLTHSRRAYERLMRRLAERSTRGEGTVGSEDGSSRDFEPYEPGEGRSARPRSGREEDEPAEWQGGRSRWGGEAKAGRNRATPVRADGPRQPGYAPCGKAGVEVEGAGWYVVQSGDTLSSIAHAHYGSGRAYWRILGANWRTIPDPGLIYACQRIYIPR